MRCVKHEKLPNLTKMFYKCFTTGFVGMATIKEVVLKHHKKEDGIYNISIAWARSVCAGTAT